VITVLIEGRVALHPTEDPGKVKSSISNIFPGSEIRKGVDGFHFITNDADNFIEIIREHRIRDTAVMIMERSRRGGYSSFFINKQAAFMGVVNFTEGDSPLGDIEVEVKEGAEKLIDSARP
jgi:hypothetical protein